MVLDYSYHYQRWRYDTPEQQEELADSYQRLLLPHLPSDRSAKLLDVGCGVGYALWALQGAGYSDLSGIDSDEGQVQAARAKGLQVIRTEDTAAWLRAQAACYEAILALDLLEHIPVNEQLDFAAALREALRDGGTLVCRVPNANSALAARYRYIDWTHHCSFTEHSLDFLLHSAGFHDIGIFPADTLKRPRLWWWPKGGTRHWWAFRFFRLLRRLEMMAELGPPQGRAVPLSLNLLGVARRR